MLVSSFVSGEHSLNPPRSGRRDVLNAPVLLLNRHFAPVSLATLRRAMVLLYAGAARAVDDIGETHDFVTWRLQPVRSTDDALAIVGGHLRVPRVLHLLRYDRYPSLKVRLTRRNLMLRDNHECQYCGRRPGVRALNIDHVVPRSRGGRDCWDNLVVSCRVCNLKKGRRTPTEAGMRLLRSPFEPHWTTAAHILMAAPSPYVEWQPFLEAG